MATGTLTFIPNADISVNHTKSSGSNGYSLLTTNDDDSSYIYQTLSSTSSTSMTSVFTLGVSGSMPDSYIRITAARLYSRARIGSNSESGSYRCYFAAGTTAGGSDNNASTYESLGSSYSTTSATSATLVESINGLITKDEFPTLSVKVTTTGTKSSGKNASNGYIRVTQVYLELDYEEVEYVPDIPDIPSEDPAKTYHSITVSSINATTDPENGTTRVEEGTNQTITIHPTDPLITLALDNGVDITNQLSGSMPTNTYSVGNVSGATYNFTLNSNGYYESRNKAKANSAAVCRVTFNLESDCNITFSYINYAEATYDYGIFGKIDTALGTTYSTDTSAAYLSCSTSAYNKSTVQTLTYQMSAGTHYIDVKYRKDSSTNSNNDSLQFKVAVESVVGGTYTYTLNNVSKKHNLTFVFGSVNYYFVTSYGGNGCRAFPDGQMVKLAGEDYSVTIVPDNINDTVILFDNNVDRTTNITRVDSTDKSGNPIVAYVYELSNINTDHTITAGCSTTNTAKIYIKNNNTWTQYSKVYVKIDGAWVEQNPVIWSALFDTSESYRKIN
jgi:hypothetical protein